MAQYFLSINRGQLDSQTGNVAIGTSAPTADMYLQISTTNNPTRKNVIQALRAFEAYLLNDGLNSGQRGVDIPPL